MAKPTSLPPPSAEVQAWRGIIKSHKRVGMALLDQQFWCWGYDIREQGNLFLRYGFAPHHQPKESGGTLYTITPTDGTLLRLWGGNLIYRDARYGVLHFNRQLFEPRLLPDDYALSSDLPEGSEIPATPDDCARAAQLTAAVLRWNANYERWVLADAGLAYRERAVQAWKTNAVMLIAAEAMAAEWERIAAGVEGYITQNIQTMPMLSN